MSGDLGFQVNVSQFIRRPVADVFQAFVDPNKITTFWLAHSTGPLEHNQRVTWTFKVPGAEVDTITRTRIDNELLHLEWSDASHLEMKFIARPDRTDYASATGAFKAVPWSDLSTRLNRPKVLRLCCAISRRCWKAVARIIWSPTKHC